MKKLLFPIILTLLAVAGGGFGGQMLKPPPPPAESADPASAGDGGAEAASAKAPDGGYDGAGAETTGKDASYAPEKPDAERPKRDFVKLDRQFVVPVLDGDRVASLVVLSIAIEVDEGAGDDVFSQEPKLRDAFLRVLFIHAQSRGFDGEFTRESRLADLRGSLAEAATEILGKASHGVLLTNIVRQDV